jgi:hypothetical protein
VEYWLFDRSPHKPSAISSSVFNDPRIEAIQCQIRQAETAQAIARLRLVRADYQKRILLLSNLPWETKSLQQALMNDRDVFPQHSKDGANVSFVVGCHGGFEPEDFFLSRHG